MLAREWQEALKSDGGGEDDNPSASVPSSLAPSATSGDPGDGEDGQDDGPQGQGQGRVEGGAAHRKLLELEVSLAGGGCWARLFGFNNGRQEGLRRDCLGRAREGSCARRC
jgi:hypothetical protein